MAFPYQINATFKYNNIGKVVVFNSGYGYGYPLPPVNGVTPVAADEAQGENVAGNGGNGGNGDTIQFNLASQEQGQDVDQTNAAAAQNTQDTGDNFSLALDFGDGSAVAISANDQDATNEQTQTNENTQEQNLGQSNEN